MVRYLALRVDLLADLLVGLGMLGQEEQVLAKG